MDIGYALLVHVVWLLSTYFIIVFLLTLLKNRNQLYDSPALDHSKELPKVSIIMSAYNEEETISDSIDSLNAIDYPKDKYEVIIVNDGSKDRTREVVLGYADQSNIIFIDNAKNKGKAACLNQGLEIAKGNYVACVDADSMVSKDILKKTIPYFQDRNMGSVTVSVQVKHTNNFLQRVIQIEYMLGLSLFLKIFSSFNCVHVTPGPFSIYRKSLLDKIGYFDVDNITEDLEIAYRIHKSGYKIANCMDTYVRTIIPENLMSLYRQRKRWYSGALMTFWQHKDIMLRKKAGLFGFFVPFNYSLIFLGLGLFVFSLYLLASSVIRNISLYSFTNYNFFSNILWGFDPLRTSILSIFVLSSIVTTVILISFGIKVIRNNSRKKVSIYFGYFLLFFMYQFFWLTSFFLVLFRRKVRW